MESVDKVFCLNQGKLSFSLMSRTLSKKGERNATTMGNIEHYNNDIFERLHVL
jgi:hypothetical protein